jgi:hypothetical protein
MSTSSYIGIKIKINDLLYQLTEENDQKIIDILLEDDAFINPSSSYRNAENGLDFFRAHLEDEATSQNIGKSHSEKKEFLIRYLGPLLERTLVVPMHFIHSISHSSGGCSSDLYSDMEYSTIVDEIHQSLSFLHGYRVCFILSNRS